MCIDQYLKIPIRLTDCEVISEIIHVVNRTSVLKVLLQIFRQSVVRRGQSDPYGITAIGRNHFAEKNRCRWSFLAVCEVDMSGPKSMMVMAELFVSDD